MKSDGERARGSPERESPSARKPRGPRRTARGETGDAKPPPRPWRFAIYVLALSGLLLLLGRGFGSPPGELIPYSEFRKALAEGRVVECVLETDRIHGKLTPVPPSEPAPSDPARSADQTRAEGAVSDAGVSNPEPTPFQTLRVEDPELIHVLEVAGVKYTGATESLFLSSLLTWVLPLLLFFGFWMFLARRAGGAGGMGGAAMSFGKSKAKLVADMDTGVDFGDVAGCDEAKLELQEVVDFLRNPGRYEKLGAKIPKGVLLVGSPGTGKTLLSRAVAGEAEVPFYSISGSDFVEMFVGVGAARVRDLFDQAKKSAPCIVFIDEVDAIGRARGVHMSPVNDEREQTLNQLLVEMDGFEPNSGVILLAATNRPDVLDRALLRPGRFDRQVVLDIPDFGGRLAILKVHAKGKPMAAGLDLETVARGTPGFSGADLANAMNEAALLAARRGGSEIAQADLEDAIEKLVAGPERKSRRLREEEKRRVAYHESGHALVARYSKHADAVHKISIVPRGRHALGFTLQLPAEDQALLTQAELEDKITGMLGGRAAEETVFAEVSTGAANDLEQATALVRQMVCIYGMGESVGLMHCAREPLGRYPMGVEGGMQRDCSEATAREIDEEVRTTLERAYGRAMSILREHRRELEKIALTLLARETLAAHEFEALLAEEVAGGAEPPGTTAGPREART